MTTSHVLSLGVAIGLITAFGTGCLTALPVSIETAATTVLSDIPENLENRQESEISPLSQGSTTSASDKAGSTKAEAPCPDTYPNLPEKNQPAAQAPENGAEKIGLFLGKDSLYYKKGSEAPFTGKDEILSAYGELIYEGQFKDGLREGEGTEWNNDGNKKYVGQWIADKFFNGTVYYYYERTDLISLQGGYIEGQLVNGINLDRNGESY